MSSNRLILASASPQRKQLLEGLGIHFEVIPSERPETDCIESDPVVRCKALARMKAEDVAKDNADAWVLGCDTLVIASDGTMLEKPKDADDARRMLKLLSGNTCTVHSALCFVDPSGQAHEGLSSSNVQFKELNDNDIEWWIATNQWKDRSGSFQIEGKGQLMVESIGGDWTGVVGLPVFLLGKLIVKADFHMQFMD